MNEPILPLTEPLAFLVDDEVTAWLLLKQAKLEHTVSEDVQRLLDTGKFHIAAQEHDPALDDAGFFERNEAAEFLEEHGVDIRIVENFDGSVAYLDDNLQPRQTEWYTNGYLVLMTPDEKPNFFRAAYTGLGDIITEFQRKLARIGAFPDGFPYYDHLVRIKGTYQEAE